ncbi:hypothetical protein B0T25DRAFT_584339 [Lasiosphaeria hispida]|uniref:Uncharacterized protein n=1 Tax=Lasiosphaeria hispida TaxID=260671 RepID=A0AAJ0H7T2_9PEZI|nr:hypothetical protein B0T25DRAFT_584339 [Lasiosphaeria hispida]
MPPWFPEIPIPGRGPVGGDYSTVSLLALIKMFVQTAEKLGKIRPGDVVSLGSVLLKWVSAGLTGTVLQQQRELQKLINTAITDPAATKAAIEKRMDLRDSKQDGGRITPNFTPKDGPNADATIDMDVFLTKKADIVPTETNAKDFVTFSFEGVAPMLPFPAENFRCEPTVHVLCGGVRLRMSALEPRTIFVGLPPAYEAAADWDMELVGEVDHDGSGGKALFHLGFNLVGFEGRVKARSLRVVAAPARLAATRGGGKKLVIEWASSTGVAVSTPLDIVIILTLVVRAAKRLPANTVVFEWQRK